MSSNFSINFALQVANALNRNADDVANLNQQLASGLRINRFGDDSAGQSFSDKLGAEVQVGKAAKNSIDNGVTLFEIADRALEAIEDTTLRMKDIAGRASDSTLSDAERDLLSQEYQLLGKELDRIVETTEFNGKYLFAGTPATDDTVVVVSDDAFAIPNPLIDPNISGDGRYITYVKQDDGQDVRQLDTLTGEINNIGVQSVTGVAASNDGRILAFYDTDNALRVYNRDDDSVIKLTSGLADAEYLLGAAVSADGSKIAFTSIADLDANGTESGANGFATLYVYDVETGTIGEAADFDLTDSTNVEDLAFSNDGSYLGIIVNEANFSGANGIYVVGTDAGQLGGGPDIVAEDLGTAVEYDTDLAVLNNGDVYYSVESESIRRYNNDDRTTDELTDSGAQLIGTAVSGDDDTIYFVSPVTPGATGSTVENVYALDVETDTFTQLTDFSNNPFGVSEDNGYELAVSSDGGSVIYQGIDADIKFLDTTPDDQVLNISTGTGSGGVISLELSAVKESVRGIRAFNLSTAEYASYARESLVNQESGINELRGIVKGAQARLESASRVTANTTAEKIDARERIRSIDSAYVLAERVIAAAKEEPASFAFAQALLQPQRVLSLLSDLDT